MDMSFATQALSLKYIVEGGKLEKRVHLVPKQVEDQVASMKLTSMGVQIDTLTPEQEEYLNSWKMGT
jgi:adenosylhomocysteinase